MITMIMMMTMMNIKDGCDFYIEYDFCLCVYVCSLGCYVFCFFFLFVVKN